MHLTKHILLLLGTYTSSALSQEKPPIDIGGYLGYRIAVSASEGNQRVGNAALVRVLTYNSELQFGMAHRLLIACDGTWISTPIYSAAQFAGPTTFAQLEAYAASRDQSLPLESVDFSPPSESDYFYASAVSRNAQKICKTAGKEPRNVIIPIASSKETENIGMSISLLLSSSTKVGKVIDMWSRSTYYKYVDLKSADGKIVEIDGVLQKTKEATGKYKLELSAFNCRERALGTYQSLNYEDGKTTPESSSLSRDGLQLNPVVPASVGEAKLDAVCRLYGERQGTK